MLFSVAQVINYLDRLHARTRDVIAMGTTGALPPAPDDIPGNDLDAQVGGTKIPGRVHMRPATSSKSRSPASAYCATQS